MESGFIAGQSDNLPKVDMAMVLDFLSKNPLHKHEAHKGSERSKSAQERYGDDAIGSVQVKREEKLCTVKAKITHKVKCKPYNCTFVCNEETDQIMSVCCEKCTASQCKHTIALVMWLNRRFEEPSYTAAKCYWIKPKPPTVESNLKFIKTADLVPLKYRKTENLKENLPLSDGSFLKEVVEMSRKLNVNSMLMLYHRKDEDPTLSIHSMACHYKRQFPKPNVDGFIQYCKEHMEMIDLKLRIIVCHEASNESVEPSWFELRYGRITAAKLHETAHCSLEDGALIDYILGAYSFKDIKSIIKKKALKAKVREIVAAKQNIIIKEGGLLLNKDYPLFGASPDGISEEFVVEIKCLLNKNIENYFQDGEITIKYLSQIQLQMLIADKRKGLFCIAHENFETSSNVDIYEVDFNAHFCSQLMDKSLLFWKKRLFKKVLML